MNTLHTPDAIIQRGLDEPESFKVRPCLSLFRPTHRSYSDTRGAFYMEVLRAIHWLLKHGGISNVTSVGGIPVVRAGDPRNAQERDVLATGFNSLDRIEVMLARYVGVKSCLAAADIVETL